MTFTRNQTIIAAAILIILAGAIGFWLGRAAERGELPSLAQPSEEEAGPAAGTALVGGNAIAVNDQPPGTTVNVSLVTLAQSGWVVVHEDLDGKPGRILGARRFDPGQNQSGAVELLRPTEEGKIYYAMLHADDGDRAFDHKKDLPITDPQGNVIFMRFVASMNAEER